MLIVLKSKDLNHSRNTSRSYSAPSYDLCLPRPEQTTDYLKILLGSSVQILGKILVHESINHVCDRLDSSVWSQRGVTDKTAVILLK